MGGGMEKGGLPSPSLLRILSASKQRSQVESRHDVSLVSKRNIFLVRVWGLIAVASGMNTVFNNEHIWKALCGYGNRKDV